MCYRVLKAHAYSRNWKFRDNGALVSLSLPLILCSVINAGDAVLHRSPGVITARLSRNRTQGFASFAVAPGRNTKPCRDRRVSTGADAPWISPQRCPAEHESHLVSRFLSLPHSKQPLNGQPVERAVAPVAHLKGVLKSASGCSTAPCEFISFSEDKAAKQRLVLR